MNLVMLRSCCDHRLLFEFVKHSSRSSLLFSRYLQVIHHRKQIKNLMSLTASNSNTNCSSSSSSIVDHFPNPATFRPKKVLVVGKFSRLEFEKHRNANLSEKQLAEHLENHGSDYKSLLYHHDIHVGNREHIVKCLQERNIECRVVNRFGYTQELIDWSDMIITSGGDGTYLLAANKIPNNGKPLIGVNSDPSRSVGHLCLDKRYSNRFDRALDAILTGRFEWDFRQRIRITLEGESAFNDPVELHDQQLMQRECRFWDLDNIHQLPGKSTKVNDIKKSTNGRRRRVLPHLALNEVFVGESLSSRVSYFEMAIDNRAKFKIKSSGTTICTGTGSTSWFFNINKLTPQCVSNLFNIINEERFNGQSPPPMDPSDQQLVQRVTDRFNNSLIYSPSQLLMAYVIRDPVVFGTNFTNNPRDFARKIVIKSRMTDAHIVIDGGLSYSFNDGSKASFEMFEQDALRAIKLKE
ncbi:NAD kinase 2, mitochondrial [Dermatophagoides farinae]|uniref:NAD kinase 2, mitochondrial n=1 Tax=Dermatophagoides farinae TaxID=6954 RepID=A0A922HR99_DERFA|nr:NAD kinase 2, mitochondrial-like isoform X2 [Dermatophagoides farinae]KAH7642798.1 nad kinase domain-containing protein 1-like protein [Dermatophagoides farinae]KAH9506193.1 NAD kinase 2, mitochondrial [Dermatophagoides farinae]